jgi:hypothetical protein
MLRMFGVVITVWSLVWLRGGLALAEEPKPAEASAADTRGRELLGPKLSALAGAERGQVIPVVDATLARTFSGCLFYVLRFRQYPVTLLPPDPLQVNNIFVVKPDGAVDHLPDVKALEIFFQSTLPRVTTDAEARDAARAWLRLVPEFHQDGFLQFSIPDESVRVVPGPGGGPSVAGKAVVAPHGGNQGEIVGSLSFDHRGRLVSASEAANIKRGIRPRCQATRLLHPDPVVRAMAEEAILVMGKAAKDYLHEQRARASPKLRETIDRLWQRILTEDR